MTSLSPSFCRMVREARRKAGLSQGEVSLEIGCKQSALSMFEQGGVTKLGDESIQKLAEKFALKLVFNEADGATGLSAPMPFVGAASMRGFCPNAHCPSNEAYTLEGRVLYQPNRLRADPAGGKFCAICGEILEKKCPNCGMPVHDGAICTFCGEPYVAAL